jgi:hypothetical protein
VAGVNDQPQANTPGVAPGLDPGVEEGPDPNDLRRHAKRMLTEFQYRQKYRRIDFYRPNEKQRLFHNTIARRSHCGRQSAREDLAAGAQMTFDAIAFYPAGTKETVP